jgi:hypothetical protein
MVMTGHSLFLLRERLPDGDRDIGQALPLDEFVQLVNATGPQIKPRQTKNDLAFAKQLVRKS